MRLAGAHRRRLPRLQRSKPAAVAAGQPPEIQNANLSYWYGQGEMANLTELVGKFKDKAGGMYDIA